MGDALIENLRVIPADSQVVEPADLWATRLELFRATFTEKI
jgi:hypothetical protein